MIKILQKKIPIIFLAGVLIFFIISLIFLLKNRNEPLLAKLKLKPVIISQEIIDCKNISVEEFESIVSDESKNNSLAVNLMQYTFNLRNFIKQIKNNKISKQNTNLTNILNTRKKLLIEALYLNPRAVRQSLLTEEEKQYLKNITKNCIEEMATLVGELQVLHADNFAKKTSVESYYLKQGSNKPISLHTVTAYRGSLRSGVKIKVRGLRIDNEIVFDGLSNIDEKVQNKFGGIEIKITPPEKILDNKKLAVILINFQNTKQPEVDKETIRKLVFENVNNYYKQTSYERMYLTGDIFGWYTISVNGPLSDSQIQNEVTEEVLKIAQKDMGSNQYDYYMFMAPYNLYWTGIGEVGGKNSWINLSSHADSTWDYWDVLAHELGHNFGLGHAKFYDCIDYLFQDCSFGEYEDYYSIMGISANHGQLNALHKETLGWLNETNIKNISTSGQYSIKPLETFAIVPNKDLQTKKQTFELNTKALKIQRTDKDYLYVEYRQPINTDADFISSIPETNVYDGALIHSSLVQEILIYPLGVFYENLIGSTLFNPRISSEQDRIHPSLLRGESFVDPLSGTKITTISKNSEELVIDVILGKTDFIPPTIELKMIEDNANPVSDMVHFTASASDDATDIEKVELYRIDPFSTDLRSKNKVLLMTDTESPYEFIFDTTKIDNGSTEVYAIAYDNSGIKYKAYNNLKISNKISFNIQNTTNSIPPTVNIKKPQEGETISSSVVSFILEGHDNLGFEQQALLHIDGNHQNAGIFVYLEDKDFSILQKVKSLEKGQYSSYFTVTDFEGNTVNSTPVNFTVNYEPPIINLISPQEGERVSSPVVFKIEGYSNTGWNPPVIQFSICDTTTKECTNFQKNIDNLETQDITLIAEEVLVPGEKFIDVFYIDNEGTQAVVPRVNFTVR